MSLVSRRDFSITAVTGNSERPQDFLNLDVETVVTHPSHCSIISTLNF
jgi:hypothetical protein